MNQLSIVLNDRHRFNLDQETFKCESSIPDLDSLFQKYKEILKRHSELLISEEEDTANSAEEGTAVLDDGGDFLNVRRQDISVKVDSIELPPGNKKADSGLKGFLTSWGLGGLVAN